jgi:diacylglycerol kinase family enzyme
VPDVTVPSPQARLSAILSILLFAVGAFLLVLMLLGQLDALALALISLGASVVGAWWLLTEKGILRALSPIPLLVGFGLLILSFALAVDGADAVFLRVVAVVVIFGSAIALARFAIQRPAVVYPEGTGRMDPPLHPVLLCNPWSGGGKVDAFGLVALAEELGVEVVMLDHGLDLEQLTRDAVARGADCLGMAGGDGSQALVASVAVEHDLPYVCIPAGTRNHFALDLGLDRDDPRSAMNAFTDAIERSVDYATVNDRLFVNNVSLGIYATIVQSDDYRDAKAEVSLSMARQLLGRQSEPFDLQYSIPDGREIEGAFLVMVSNNPYVLDANPAVAQRHDMDSGRLGIFAISTRTGGQAARLMTLSALGLRDVSRYWREFTAEEFEVRSRSGTAPMGVDGESLVVDTPLRMAIHPRGLRMFVPDGNLDIAEKRRAWKVRGYQVLSVAFGRKFRFSNLGG